MSISADLPGKKAAENQPRLFRFVAGPAETSPAAEALARYTGLSKAKVKDAMAKGAVWLHARRGGRKRLRRASAQLSAGDVVEFFYDARLLDMQPPTGQCLHDAGHYSVWLKPAGLLAQGTDYGDHCSLLRQVELFFGRKRPVLPVHRLDREASGIMLVAHSRDAAARLSLLLQENRIEKRYRITVTGRLDRIEGGIDLPLDGKAAETRYRVDAYDPASDSSVVEVEISSGRLHQIRRHFALIGHPVLGDPRYGRGNKNKEGMRLVAYFLAFRCPFTGKDLCFTI